MALTAEQLAISAFWLEQFTEASADLQEQAAQIAMETWLAFEAWYSATAVAVTAAELAQLSTAAQQISAGLAAEYVVNVTAATGGAVAEAPTNPFQGIRNSVSLSLVHTRPAEAYKRAIATGATHQEALALAGLRAANLMRSDISLQDRAAMSAVMEAIGVTGYRRVIRPELSRTGTCGLCIAAADRIYKTGELMPIHPPSCKCVVMPIIGDSDPGRLLNEVDLGQLYDLAGSTSASDLSHVRYQVNQHGEFGPVLTREGDDFRGPSKVALEDDPERAARLLDTVRPVLTLLEGRERAGEDLSDELAYQRKLIARLSRIVGPRSSAA